MAIKHATTKAAEEKLYAEADWNADHEIEQVDELPATGDEAEIIYLTSNKHLYLNQEEG